MARHGRLESMGTNKVSLFREEREIQILELLKTDQRVEVARLAQLFDVSEDTIRRDLRALENQGLLVKIHGGALNCVAAPKSFENRLEHASQYKSSIGKAAAGLVEEGECFLIDSGTTALSVARSLRVNKAKVLTNSLEVANVISAYSQIDLIVLGGRWDPLHQLVGPVTVEQLSRYRVDKVFLGMPGLDMKQGITVPSEEEAAVKRAMIQIAQQVIGLADHTKLGEVAFSYVAPASSIDILVTDELANLGPFGDLSWKIIRVNTETE
jgi:DeoR/GlpR family transcriptional regulator of sugar metabolism